MGTKQEDKEMPDPNGLPFFRAFPCGNCGFVGKSLAPFFTSGCTGEQLWQRQLEAREDGSTVQSSILVDTPHFIGRGVGLGRLSLGINQPNKLNTGLEVFAELAFHFALRVAL